MSVSSQTALVTGASAGLGREYARLFASDGHDVVLVARREDRLAALAAELEAAHGVTATVLPADLADPGSPARIASALDAQGTSIDFLVNNAGFGTVGPVAETDCQRQLDMIQVNVLALVHLTRLLLPGMLERGRGRILNIGSTAGFQPGPGMATYFATKAFVNHWTEALAHELRGTGVTATVSCPGATESEFGALAGNDASLLFKMGAMGAEPVVRAGYGAMMAGRPLVIHGIKNRLGVESLRLAPRSVAVAMAAMINRTD